MDVNKRSNGFKHGLTGTKVWKAWQSMRQRCIQPTHPAYSMYGGRGIKICKRWELFSNFLSDMGFPPTSKHTLERINNSQGYSKPNCVWALFKVQCRNRRSNIFYTLNGRTQCLAAWAEEYNKPYSLLYSRIQQGKRTLKQALKEVRSAHLYFTFKGKTQHLKDWAKEYNQPYSMLWQRMRYSTWNLERALTEPRHREKISK